MSSITRLSRAVNDQLSACGTYVSDLLTKFPKASQEKQASTILKVIAVAAVIYLIGLKTTIGLAVGAFLFAIYSKMNDGKPLDDLSDWVNKLAKDVFN